MDAHTRKTYETLTGHPAPTDLEWNKFVTLWEDLADSVKQESGDRLAVSIHGHREVFHRPHDGRVSIEDVERARHLLAAVPDLKGAGELIAVAIDERQARIIGFDLDETAVDASTHTVRDGDVRSRHLRTVERHTGRDDERALEAFFDQVATEVEPLVRTAPLVVLGHGDGKANAAEGFVTRLRAKHPAVAEHLRGVGDIDLSAASDAALEAKAITLL